MEQVTVNGGPVDYSGLPEHMQGAMQRYIDNGIEPGSFLLAVLCNDLAGAVGRADSVNRARINDYVMWMHNDAPAACHGSREKVAEWIRARNAT